MPAGKATALPPSVRLDSERPPPPGRRAARPRSAGARRAARAGLSLLASVALVVPSATRAAQPAAAQARAPDQDGQPREQGPRAVGWLEAVVFPEADLRVVAKLDTGAKTSSLDAEDVKLFERGGEQWASFGVRRKRGQGPVRRMEARVVGERRIRTATGRESRPVVALWLCVAGERRRVLFTLGSRRDMNYRVILGRRALEGRLLVDASRKFTVQPGCEVKE